MLRNFLNLLAHSFPCNSSITMGMKHMTWHLNLSFQWQLPSLPERSSAQPEKQHDGCEQTQYGTICLLCVSSGIECSVHAHCSSQVTSSPVRVPSTRLHQIKQVRNGKLVYWTTVSLSALITSEQRCKHTGSQPARKLSTSLLRNSHASCNLCSDFNGLRCTVSSESQNYGACVKGTRGTIRGCVQSELTGFNLL